MQQQIITMSCCNCEREIKDSREYDGIYPPNGFGSCHLCTKPLCQLCAFGFRFVTCPRGHGHENAYALHDGDTDCAFCMYRALLGPGDKSGACFVCTDHAHHHVEVPRFDEEFYPMLFNTLIWRMDNLADIFELIPANRHTKDREALITYALGRPWVQQTVMINTLIKRVNGARLVQELKIPFIQMFQYNDREDGFKYTHACPTCGENKVEVNIADCPETLMVCDDCKSAKKSLKRKTK